jgi:hypothetical protein
VHSSRMRETPCIEQRHEVRDGDEGPRLVERLGCLAQSFGYSAPRRIGVVPAQMAVPRSVCSLSPHMHTVSEPTLQVDFSSNDAKATNFVMPESLYWIDLEA